MGLWTFLEFCLLVANALAILNEDRFLAPRGWSFQYSGVNKSSLKGQIVGFIYATQYSRVLLILLNTLCIIFKLLSGWCFNRWVDVLEIYASVYWILIWFLFQFKWNWEIFFIYVIHKYIDKSFMLLEGKKFNTCPIQTIPHLESCLESLFLIVVMIWEVLRSSTYICH